MDADNPADSSPKVHDIAPDGDIVLIVGGEKTHLRVHSLFLKTASKVFSAMFGPRFREGQTLSDARPREVPMPDDNAPAMTIICNIIHHRNDVLPNKLQPTELVQVAMAADKYDCTLILKFVMRHWLGFKELASFAELGCLMAAAYVSDNSNAFWKTTQRLVLDYCESYQLLASEDYGGMIPWTCYYMLEATRSRLRLDLQQILLDGAANVDCRWCEYASKQAYAYMQTLTDTRLWGPFKYKSTVNTAIRSIETLTVPSFYGNASVHASVCSGHKEQQTKEMRESRLQDLKATAGLCLGCVKSGELEPDFPCQMNH